MTTIIGALKEYLLTCPTLRPDAEMSVDFVGPDSVGYSIIPLPGDKVQQAYVDGGSERSYPFAFQSVESTADELARLETNGFYEGLAAWFESQTLLRVLPALGPGKEATAIEATGWGYLYQQEGSTSGMYQVQCRLVYEQAKL